MLARETLHDQIIGILRKKINNGEYTEKIPSEVELMKTFDVSRATIREAISALVQEGLLIRQQGKGTFISDRPVSEWLGHLNGFSELMTQMGYRPTAETIRSELTQNVEIGDSMVC